MGGPAYIKNESGEVFTYDAFDNFNTDFPFKFNGETWLSAEQAYQAAKFTDKDYQLKIRNEKRQLTVWSMGQSNEHAKAPWGNETKVLIMYEVNKTRINQYPELQRLLLSTGDGMIVFPGSDAFWGTSGNPLGSGGCENWNGKNLMAIRRMLRFAQQNL